VAGRSKQPSQGSPASQPGLRSVSNAVCFLTREGSAAACPTNGITEHDDSAPTRVAAEAGAKRRALIRALARQAARELAGKPNKEPSD